MNLRTGLAAVAVMELFTLVSLGHYSHRLHQLQGTRSLLASRATAFPPSGSSSSSSSVLAATARVTNQKEPWPSQLAGVEEGVKVQNNVLSEAQKKQQEVQQGIQALEQQIRQQQLLFQQRDQQQRAGTAAAAPPTNSAQANAESSRNKDDDDDDDENDHRVETTKARSTGSQTAIATQLYPIPPAVAITAAAEAASMAGPSAVESPAGLRMRVQGAGDWEVLWHDGSLHARHFALKDSVYALSVSESLLSSFVLLLFCYSLHFVGMSSIQGWHAAYQKLCTYACSLSLYRSLSASLARSHSHSRALSLSGSLSFAPAHALSFSHTHTVSFFIPPSSLPPSLIRSLTCLSLTHSNTHPHSLPHQHGFQANAFYDTIGSEVAHRLSYQGTEVSLSHSFSHTISFACSLSVSLARKRTRASILSLSLSHFPSRSRSRSSSPPRKTISLSSLMVLPLSPALLWNDGRTR